MKRCLLATPLRLGARATFIGALVDVAKNEIPGWQIDTVCMEGPAVNFARNELAHYAVAEGYDRTVQCDEDMQWTRDNLARLLSHDVPVVGAPYCIKTGGTPRWLHREREGAVMQENGLIECDYVATGFISISTDALRAIADRFPDRHFAYREDGADRIMPRFDWFPMEVVGEGSAESRLRKVESILTWAEGDKIPIAINAIRDAVERPHELGRLLGEDYGFCRLARAAGLPLYLDRAMPVIPHVGEIAFPLKSAQSFEKPPFLMPQ